MFISFCYNFVIYYGQLLLDDINNRYAIYTVFSRLFAPYIPPPSLNRHGFTFTKVLLSLYFMSNFTLFYLPTSQSANIPKGGR